MSITDLFIRRAVTTTLLMAGLLGFGLLSYFTLPVSDLPPVEYPTIQVTANLPGANPDIMASSVATPLEKAFSNIAGVANMSSANTNAQTIITLEFDFSRTIDAAAQDVQSAISRAGGELPRNMLAPPWFRKVNPASRPVVFLALTSDTMTLAALNEYGENLISRRISMINGVAQVLIFGGEKYAVRVEADPDRLAARQVGLEEIRSAFTQQNVNLPAGSMHGVSKAYTVQSNSQLNAAEQFRPMVVAYRNGNPVRLEDVANVRDSVISERNVFWVNGKPGMIVAVQKQPGANTVEVVDEVKRQLPSLQQNMPAGISLQVQFDASRNIRESIEDVKFTLLLTIALVILVIFIFLRNVSATVIASLAVPLSLLGTFAVMKVLDFTIDTLSMMAMTLSVGFVVDDAIVMLENIVRHLEMGKPRMQAALDGAREVSFTILSMTISLVAVFIPVLFLEGIIGRLLREFSITIAVAVLISGLISLSLTPMLCSRFLRHQQTHGRMFNLVERFFTGMNNLYRRTLRTTLRFRFVTLLATLALTVVSGWLFTIMPKSFVPLSILAWSSAARKRRRIPLSTKWSACKRRRCRLCSGTRGCGGSALALRIRTPASSSLSSSLTRSGRTSRRSSRNCRKSSRRFRASRFFCNHRPCSVSGRASRDTSIRWPCRTPKLRCSTSGLRSWRRNCVRCQASPKCTAISS